jgi:hypothetical protein
MLDACAEMRRISRNKPIRKNILRTDACSAKICSTLVIFYLARGHERVCEDLLND